MSKSQYTLLDGKQLAAKIRSRLAKDIQASGIIPGLAAVLVGNDDASKLYIGLKEKAAQEAGICFERIELPSESTQELIISVINELNERSYIHGILVQLPLPKYLDTNIIINNIDPQKDADGFHPENIRRIAEGKPQVISPPHAGVLRLLKETKIQLENKKAALLVNSHEFGDPLENLLKIRGIEVANLVKKNNYQPYTKKADIIVVAVGKANLIKGKDIKKGAIVIDIGTNKVNDKLCGDVDFESVKDKVSFITPVPGGVGPLTVAFLLENVFTLAKQLNKNKVPKHA